MVEKSITAVLICLPNGRKTAYLYCSLCVILTTVYIAPKYNWLCNSYRANFSFLTYNILKTVYHPWVMDYIASVVLSSQLELLIHASVQEIHFCLCYCLCKSPGYSMIFRIRLNEEFSSFQGLVSTQQMKMQVTGSSFYTVTFQTPMKIIGMLCIYQREWLLSTPCLLSTSGY